jgi:hypothetical protein
MKVILKNKGLFKIYKNIQTYYLFDSICYGA